MSIILKVKSAMRIVILDLFVLLFLANELLKFAILNDKRHLQVIIVRDMFYFVYNVCYCIFKLKSFFFFCPYEFHWFRHIDLKLLKSSFSFFLSAWYVRIGIF